MAGCSKRKSRKARVSEKTRRTGESYVEPLSETRTTAGEKRVPGFRARSDRRVGRVKSIRLGRAGENNDFFNSLQGWKG